jgi:hypothetical protein
MRRALLLSAKAAISILLLYFSLRWGNVSTIPGRLSRLEPGWVALALGLLTTQIVFLAIRWKTIAVACGANLSFVPALQLSFIAAFFNQVLPSTVGGDGARIWLLARRGAAGWARATYSVLIDRIVGVFALALVVLVCLPWTFELIHDAIARTVLLMIRIWRNHRRDGLRLYRREISEIVRSMDPHTPSGGGGTRRGNPVWFTAVIRVCDRLLHRNSFNHYRGSMVLRKGDRCARQFPAGTVPYPSRIAHIVCTDIDRRLGCPRNQHDRRFRRCWPRSK